MLLIIFYPLISNVCLLVSSCEDPGERGIIKFGQQFFLKTLPGIGGDVRLRLVKFLYIRSEVSLYSQ